MSTSVRVSSFAMMTNVNPVKPPSLQIYPSCICYFTANILPLPLPFFMSSNNSLKVSGAWKHKLLTNVSTNGNPLEEKWKKKISKVKKRWGGIIHQEKIILRGWKFKSNCKTGIWKRIGKCPTSNRKWRSCLSLPYSIWTPVDSLHSQVYPNHLWFEWSGVHWTGQSTWSPYGLSPLWNLTVNWSPVDSSGFTEYNRLIT